MKFIKKIMVLALLLSSFVHVSMREVRAEELSGSLGDNLTYHLDTETGVLTISGNGPMPDNPYYSSSPWFNNKYQVRSIIIEDGVTRIGNYSFCELSNLVSVTIASSVESIGSNAFSSLPTIEAIPLPEGLQRLDSLAIRNCNQLASIHIPSTVTSIGNYSINACQALSTITVDENNTVYDSRNNCNAIIETTTGTLIVGCANTVIPEDATAISESAFAGCNGLTSIVIPSNIKTVDTGAFSRCLNLSSITIEEGVESLGKSAFAACQSLESIIIPSSITELSDSLFSSCIKLTTVELPSTITSIGYGVFAECEKLTDVEIPEGVTSIDTFAFLGCSSLTSLHIPSTVCEIGTEAFSECDSLEAVTVSDNNTVFDSRDNCNAIIKTANNELIFGIKNTTVPAGVKRIGRTAFIYCRGLTSIVIPEGVESIGDNAFKYCQGLVSVELPSTLTVIEDYGFTCCTSLSSITLPENLRSIGQAAFISCGFTDIVIPNGVTRIERETFSNCRNIETLIVPSSVTSVGPSAFNQVPVVTVYCDNTCINADNRYGATSVATIHYETPVYQWSDDNLYVIGKVCVTEGEHELIVENVQTEKLTDNGPTCLEDGYYEYVATFESDKLETQRKIVPAEAIGHDYEYTEIVWADDYTAQAVYTCTHDATHVEPHECEVTSEVTKPATCEKEGTRLYTATYEGHTSTKEETIPATGHEWGTPSYEWSDDNSTVTAKVVCANNEEHVITETVETTYVITATCEKAGQKIYTAEFENELFTTQTKSEVMNALGHDWSDVTYTWADDNSTVTATRTCKNDPSHIETETVNTSSVTAEPTCENAGTVTYTAEFENEAFETQTRIVDGEPALGHDWGTPTYTWAEDNTSVTATRVCGHNAEHVESETVSVTSETVEPTCEEAGKIIYTSAEFENEEFEVQTKTVDGEPALGHDWGAPTYQWSEDNSSVTATRVCGHNDEHKETETVDTTRTVTDPTCEEAGKIIYTAEFENAAFETQTIELPGDPATGHEWGEITYIWVEDNSTVTATRICTHNDEHVQSETVTTTSVTIAPTCEEAGKIIYTSAEFENEAFEVQTKEVEGEPALGHDWGAPTYEWSEDNSSVTATRVCAHDPEHKETEIAIVSVTVVDPTCETAGKTVYTAEFENEAFEVQTREAPGEPALGHDWGTPTYEWSEDNLSVTATVVCQRDASHVITETVNTTVRETATCEEAGERIYTAEFENELFTPQTKSEAMDALGHKWGDPTYEWSDDNTTVTATRVCKHDFEHKETETVTATVKVVDPTCEEAGKTVYTAEFENEAFEVQTKEVPGDPALGHDWGAPTYEWSYDNTTVTATRVCSHNGEHKETETVSTTRTVVDPTCEEAGKIIYTAEFENEAFETQTIELPGDPATGHEWGEITYTWAEDNSTVTATRTCTHNPEHVQSETVATTSETVPPTCEEAGKTVYTAEFENEAFEVQTKEVPGDPALGHDWGAPTYEWSEDNSTVTATRVCSHNSEHKETETVTAKKTEVAPTCESAGTNTYEAVFENTAFEKQIKTVNGAAATGHEYVFTHIEWTGYTAKAVYTCKHDASHTVTYDCELVSTVVKQPTCEVTGSREYTAKYDGHTSTIAEVIPALGHSFTHYVSNNDADFDHDGTKTAHCDRGCGATDTVTDPGSKLVASSIEMASMPKKTEYAINEPIDLTGAKIKTTLTNGKTMEMDVTKAMVSGFDSSKEGTCTVTVTFRGKTTTFKVTVKPSYLRGDFNKDKKVTDADAIYLLMSTFFSSEYPLNQPGDFNADRKVTDADAIYLLMYTFFPSEYPLN